MTVVAFYELNRDGPVPAGTITLRNGLLVLDPPEDTLLKNVVLDPVYDREHGRWLSAAAGEEWLQLLPEKYHSPYLRAEIVEEKMQRRVKESPFADRKSLSGYFTKGTGRSCRPGETRSNTGCIAGAQDDVPTPPQPASQGPHQQHSGSSGTAPDPKYQKQAPPEAQAEADDWEHIRIPGLQGKADGNKLVEYLKEELPQTPLYALAVLEAISRIQEGISKAPGDAPKLADEIRGIAKKLNFQPTPIPPQVAPSSFSKALGAYATKKWVTMGGQYAIHDGREEQHHGGTPVQIEDATGKIQKGPPGTVGKTPDQLPKKPRAERQQPTQQESANQPLSSSEAKIRKDTAQVLRAMQAYGTRPRQGIRALISRLTRNGQQPPTREAFRQMMTAVGLQSQAVRSVTWRIAEDMNIFAPGSAAASGGGSVPTRSPAQAPARMPVRAPVVRPTAAPQQQTGTARAYNGRPDVVRAAAALGLQRGSSLTEVVGHLARQLHPDSLVQPRALEARLSGLGINGRTLTEAMQIAREWGFLVREPLPQQQAPTTAPEAESPPEPTPTRTRGRSATKDALAKAIDKFGKPRNIKLQLTGGEAATHNQIIAKARSFFGKRLSSEDIAAITNAVDGAEVTITIRNDTWRGAGHKRLNLFTQHDGVYAGRSFHKDPDGKIVVHNDIFTIGDSSSYKGQGFKILARQVQALRDAGVDRIETHAAGQGSEMGHSSMNGFYTWPRLGYDGTIGEGSFNRLPAPLKRQMGTARNIRALFDLPGGKEAWKKWGSDIYDAKFDLTPGSRSLQVLEEYIKEREKEGSHARS